MSYMGIRGPSAPRPDWLEGSYIFTLDTRPRKDKIEWIGSEPAKAYAYILYLERRKFQLEKFIADREVAIPKVFEEIIETAGEEFRQEQQEAVQKGKFIGYLKVLDTVRTSRVLNVPC